MVVYVHQSHDYKVFAGMEAEMFKLPSCQLKDSVFAHGVYKESYLYFFRAVVSNGGNRSGCIV